MSKRIKTTETTSGSKSQPTNSSSKTSDTAQVKLILLEGGSGRSNHVLRMKVLQSLYDVLSSHEKDASREILVEKAQSLEVELFRRSTPATYRSLAAAKIVALKKSSGADMTKEGLESTSEPAFETLLPFLLSADRFEALDYPRQLSDTHYDSSRLRLDSVNKICARCKKSFLLNAWSSSEENSVPSLDVMEACQYHWRRIGGYSSDALRYNCCGGSVGSSSGCCFGPHVFQFESFKAYMERFRFAQWHPVNDLDRKPLRQWNVIAFDCEMAYTSCGLEAIRISAVNYQKDLLIDCFIEVEGVVLDYNTRWSGIDADSYQKEKKVSLAHVHLQLFSQMTERCALVGHSLDSDLKALRIIHSNVIDTSLLYPHPKGLPYRYSLQYLTKKYIGKFIQQDEAGHDSFEDAKAAMDLLLYALKQKPRTT